MVPAATELEPNTLPFWAYRADAATDLDQYTEAAECYERMIELEPTRALFHSNLGWLRQWEGRYDEATERYETALRLRPDFPEALVGMGGLLEELGNMDAAEAWFRKAVESNPADTKAIARMVRPRRFQVSDADLHLLETRIADPSLAETARDSHALRLVERPRRAGTVRRGRQVHAPR